MKRSNCTIMKETGNKIAVFLLLTCTLMSFLACEDKQNTIIPEKYLFSTHGVSFSVGDDCDRVRETLGKPNLSTSAPSCAGEGEDELYIYSGFKLYSHRDGDECVIEAIELTNDTVGTSQGVFIGEPSAKLDGIYGKGESVSGGVEYAAKSGVLRFYIKDGIIVGIKYL